MSSGDAIGSVRVRKCLVYLVEGGVGHGGGGGGAAVRRLQLRLQVRRRMEVAALGPTAAALHEVHADGHHAVVRAVLGVFGRVCIATVRLGPLAVAPRELATNLVDDRAKTVNKEREDRKAFDCCVE